MFVSAPQDSGNIEVINTDNSQDIHLKIRPDNHAHYYQWFYFKVEGTENESFVIKIDNAGGASYPGWLDFGVAYRATASADGEHWSRLDTTFEHDSGVLTIQGQLTSDRMAIAFFPPYAYARHLKLIEKARSIPNCTVTSLGKSVEGRDLTLLTLGTPGADKKNIWVIARQHPGETMAEWYVEGLIDRLAAGDDLSALFDNAVLYIVPNMNPDGSYHGNLRTNALGKDLNRQWDITDNQFTAPEVYYVRKAILQKGIAAMFDVHGDETHPYVFLNGRDVRCAPAPDMFALEKSFLDAYRVESDCLQEKSCYAPSYLGQSDKNIAKNFFAERLNCLSFTVEMPNKEIVSDKKIDEKHTTRDWTPHDCKQFGAHLIPSLLKVLPELSNKKLLSQAPMSQAMSFIGGAGRMEEFNGARNGVYSASSIMLSIVMMVIVLYQHVS